MKYILIAYFLGKICAKNCRNRTVYVKIRASQRWNGFFETQCRYSFLIIPLFEFMRFGAREIHAKQTVQTGVKCNCEI